MTPDIQAAAEQVAKTAVEHMLEQAAAAKAEEEKWSAKRKVSVAAKARNAADPNARKFKVYPIPGGAVLQVGGPYVEVELTEREIFNLKLDAWVSVDDPQDAAQQAAKKAAEAAAHTKALEAARALLAAEDATPTEPPKSAPTPAAEALQELQASKKGKRY